MKGLQWYLPDYSRAEGPRRHRPVLQGTSHIPLGPYRRPVPRVLGGSWGGGRFLMGEVPPKPTRPTNHRGSVNTAYGQTKDKLSSPKIVGSISQLGLRSWAGKSQSCRAPGCSAACRARNPQKARCGGIPSSLLEPFCGHLSPKLDKVS